MTLNCINYHKGVGMKMGSAVSVTPRELNSNIYLYCTCIYFVYMYANKDEKWK